MTGLNSTSLSIRIMDTNYPLIAETVRERFPELDVTGEPVGEREGVKVLVSYYPPEDEDLSVYDWINIPAAGVDRMLAGLEGTGHSPVITRTIGRMGEQIGEYCLAYALAELQKMRLREAFQSESNWWKKKAAPDHVFDKTIAILGTGAIGQGIAQSFKALGARVVGYSRSGTLREPFDEVCPLSVFGEGASPDVLISALPWTAETENLIGSSLFSVLTGALFINVGRGASLDDDALKVALEGGQVSRAVLDVFRTEPLPAEHWFWSHEQVTVTPHVSGLTRPQDAADTFARHLKRVLKTGALPETEVDLARGY